ncbi:cell division protein CrgA [Stackebrandtia soli]|uniref:cell division protein CrgA n=1 Tax=Stackebrandtia soli TaxID=1892856 RepID=UPI0039EB58DA
MPKSRVRKKKVYTAPAELRPKTPQSSSHPSPTWVPVLAVVLIVLGIGWLVTYYLTSGEYPVLAWGYWNLGIGFAGLVASLLVLSRWR